MGPGKPFSKDFVNGQVVKLRSAGFTPAGLGFCQCNRQEVGVGSSPANNAVFPISVAYWASWCARSFPIILEWLGHHIMIVICERIDVTSS